MVVETETGRDESEAAAATASAMDDGPCGESEGGGDAAAKAVGAKDAGEGDEPKEEEEDGRDREEEEEEAAKRGWSEIRLAIEELSAVDVERRGGKPPPPLPPPPTLTFLALSHLLLQVLDKIGPTMAVLRLDVQRNIERLQELYLLDPSKYYNLEEILEKEVDEGTARKRLEEDSDQKCFAQLVESAYMVTLKPWHGWISSAAYKIAMKLIPDRKMFINLLVGKCQDCAALKEEIRKLAKLLKPFLDDIHAMMAKFRLDRLKST
uniref:Glycolipid transfer protein domain-containing protein n=1 Tax=Oryza rufipogon TaxID=4529 RepID=A0A0E0P9H7_ORYRU